MAFSNFLVPLVCLIPQRNCRKGSLAWWRPVEEDEPKGTKEKEGKGRVDSRKLNGLVVWS